MVLSLYAKSLTTGEISAHFTDVHGASVSKDTVSRITDRVLEEIASTSTRPLESGRFLAKVANRVSVLWVAQSCHGLGG